MKCRSIYMNKITNKILQHIGGQHCYCRYCVGKGEKKFTKQTRARIKQLNRKQDK